MNSSDFDTMLSAVRRGDQQAAADLVRSYEPYLCRVVRMRFAGHEQLQRGFDSLDICQSILAQFFARAAAGEFELHTAEDLRKLLVTMAINKVISKFRREQHHGGGLPPDWDTPSPEPSPTEAVADRELVEQIRRRLSERERWLFEQNRVLGRTWADIAAEEGASRTPCACN